MTDRGYTLIEGVLAAALVGIGLALSVPLFRGFLSERALQNAAYLIQGDLRLAQQAAVSRAGSSYRVEMCFSPAGYEIYAVDYANIVERNPATLVLGPTLKAATAGQAWRSGIAIAPDATAIDPCMSDAALNAIKLSGAGVCWPAPGSCDDASAKNINLTLNGRSRRVRITPTTGRACVDDPTLARCP